MSVIVVLTMMISFSDICFADTTRVPAMFIFGDSMFDAGNNNYLQTPVKAFSKPYGIDFGKPTGRFTNDRTVVDILGNHSFFVWPFYHAASQFRIFILC